MGPRDRVASGYGRIRAWLDKDLSPLLQMGYRLLFIQMGYWLGSGACGGGTRLKRVNKSSVGSACPLALLKFRIFSKYVDTDSTAPSLTPCGCMVLLIV